MLIGAIIARAHTGRQVWLAVPWSLVESKKTVLFQYKTVLRKEVSSKPGSNGEEKIKQY